MMESLTGNLLVASSTVTDPLRAGGVCLIVHQDESDVIGVMLNRPMRPDPAALAAMFGKQQGSGMQNRLTAQDPTVQDPVEDQEPLEHLELSDTDSADVDDQPSEALVSADQLETPAWRTLHFGGPLSGPVVAIHQISQYAEAETGSGIYVAAQKHHLEDLIRRQNSPYRLIVGHLGWKGDELHAEIEAGSWHVVPATVDAVFASAGEMWPGLIRRATSNSMARWLGIRDVVGAGQWN